MAEVRNQDIQPQSKDPVSQPVQRIGLNFYVAALTIAQMPARVASGSLGQASTISAE